MKNLRAVLLLVPLLLTTTITFASEPKTSDFDTSFVVAQWVYDGHDFSMILEAGTTNYDVRWHYSPQQIRHGCPSHHSGEHLQGRIKGGVNGYRIELLGVNSKGKPSVETWYITNQIQ